MRKEVPLAVTFIAGMIVVVGYFFQWPALKEFGTQQMLNWAVVVAAFAMALGAGNMTRIHALNISRRARYWQYSIILIVCLYGYLIYGIARGATDERYQWLFNNALVPGNATVFSLNGFFIIGAAYRTWRLRNWRATLLVISALFVVLGRVGIGQAMWPALGPISDWIMTYPNAAGMRGIIIGAAIGTVSLSMRILLGIERGHLGIGAEG